VYNTNVCADLIRAKTLPRPLYAKNQYRSFAHTKD
jgi:hypothetical protein